MKDKTIPQQIIQDEYRSNPELKVQLDNYELTLDDVGVRFVEDNTYYKCNETIVLNYSKKDKEVVSMHISFDNPKTKENMNSKRLERIGKIPA